MEDDCAGADNSNYYQKRSDNGLVFMVGPGGRAAVVTIQTADEPQAPASSQISSPQETLSAIVVPLSPATLSNDASTAIAEASGTRIDVTTLLSPSTPLFYTPTTTTFDPSTISAVENSVLPETPTILASISTDGVFAPSETVIESSLQANLPTTVSSEVVNLKPPIYAGIALGTIAGIACFTALIAWWIRIRSHAKRRRLYGDTDVPWAPSENTDGGLEEARDMTQTRSNLESIGLGGREDLAQVEAWEPRGDRDAGEPRRSESYPNGSADSSGHFAPFVHDPYPCRAIPGQHDNYLPFIRPLQDGPYPNARALPSYMDSIDSSSSGSIYDHAAASSLGPLCVANLLPGDRSAATSRAATALGMNSRAHATDAEDFDDLDDLLREAERCTLGQRSHSSYSWTNSIVQREVDTQSEKNKQTTVAPESEGWTASLKSIFTVMASNLSTRSKSVRREDPLTPMPPRRSARGSIYSRDDESTSGDTAGFRESSTEHDECTEADPDASGGAGRPQLPLTSRTSAKSGQLRRDLLTRTTRQDQRRSSQDTLSRTNSIYSTSSAGLSANGHPSLMLSRNGTRQGTEKGREKLGIRRPPAVARVSSTGCSVASSQMTDNEEAAQRALIGRRRRARRQDEWSEQEGPWKLG